MKVIALIPARSGSKRLPGKNVKVLNKKPLIWYSIQAGLLADSVSETYVSSDDDFIGDLAISYGAKFLKRPLQFSTDLSTTAEVLIHAAESLNLGDEDLILTLQPTNPLRPSYLINDILAFVASIEKNWTSLTTVSLLKSKFGILTGRYGLYQPYNYLQGQRSQDIEERFFYENGLVYLTKVGPLLMSGNMFGDMVLGYKTDSDYSEVDIDTVSDFKFAELMYTELKHKYCLF